MSWIDELDGDEAEVLDIALSHLIARSDVNRRLARGQARLDFDRLHLEARELRQSIREVHYHKGATDDPR